MFILNLDFEHESPFTKELLTEDSLYLYLRTKVICV